jgi:hypothetical protein
VAAALDRSGGDEQLAGEAVREYFRLDDSWIRDRGFDVFGFVKRIPTCVDRAIAARESRRRDEAQRAQADLMAVMAPVASCAAPQLKARAIERTRGLTDAELEQERMRALRFLNGGGS